MKLMARYQLTFGPPIDTRKVPCDRCGLMDASVKRWGNQLPCTCGNVPLCEDCFNIHADEIAREVIG